MATPATFITRPSNDEYAPYYQKYIALVPEGDIVATLTQQLEASLKLLRGIDDDQANKSYAPGKWSIKEVVGHLIDGERVFIYRAMRFARNDKTPLPGFEQDDYVRSANFNDRQLPDLAQEFEFVRRGAIQFFKSLSDEAWARRGTANDNQVSVRALAYIMAGHEAHHLQVIRTRYLNGEAK